MARTNRSICWTCFGLSLLALVAALASAALGHSSITGPAVVILSTALALAFMTHATLRGVYDLGLGVRGGVLIGLLLMAAVAAAKLVIGVLFRGPENCMDRALTVVSMAGICFIIAIITSRSREQLLTVGAALIAAAIVHNTTGYVLGYWGARLAGLTETACRTVAIEVGLQNGGMASGLAINVLQSSNAALAPAIFGPWMNVSGSVLATWWHRRQVREVGREV